MKVKVSELQGAALDWAVLVALYGKHDASNPEHVKHFREIRGGHPCHQQSHYSTNWAHGGPIIERERIMVAPGPQWSAVHHARLGRPYYGTTPLVAAMRCYIARKMGYEIEIPDVLVK